MGTLLDLASLVMIPSGYKDDKLYSVKPTDGSGDFTFSRDGSGASPATRVNASGLIEKGRTNLILQSNSFDTTWFAGGTISVTGGQSGYDGTNDAWLLDKTQANAHWRQDFTFDGSIVTYSLYVKAGSLNWVNLNYGGTNSYFDLANGLRGVSTAIDSTIEDIGGGWYRCSAVNNYNGISSVRIYPADADNDTSGTSGNIYIQDAQLEQGLVATDYIETTTAPVSAGLLGDMPRLDYSGGATCPSLLLEPSRVNKNLQSEYFGTWYTTDNQTISSNEATSPEGVQNAALLSRTSSSGNSRLQTPIVSVTSGASVVHSVFVKANTANNVILYSTQGGEGKKFDLSTGTAGDNFISAPDDYGIEPYANDWYRIWISTTMPSTSAQAWLYIDDTATTNIYAYGFMTEEGSYPTSYIPTYGSASTRGADACFKTGISSLIGQTEGTLFIEANLTDVDSSAARGIAELNDGGTLSRITLFRNSNGTIRLFVRNGGTTQMDETFATPPSGATKIAIGYASNDIVLYVNGSLVASDTSATIPACSDLDVGQIEGNLTKALGDSIKQTLLFPTRLTNAELAALTTL